MVRGDAEEVNHMKLASWFIFGGLVWFALPIIFPVAVLYIIIRLLNSVVIGKSIEEAHNDN